MHMCLEAAEINSILLWFGGGAAWTFDTWGLGSIGGPVIIDIINQGSCIYTTLIVSHFSALLQVYHKFIVFLPPQTRC